MNRVLNFTSTENQQSWFSADFHWNHNPKWDIPIWKMRGYNSVYESNAHIVDTTNLLVKATDNLFLLGDIALNVSEQQFEDLLNSIKCRNIYFVFGNHSSRVKDIYKREIDKWFYSNDEGYYSDQAKIDGNTNPEMYPFRYRNLIFLGNYAEITVNHQPIILSHYPMYSWNKMSHGSWCLSGHLHSTKDNYTGKHIDVGWDAFKKPMSFDELVLIMNKKPIFKEGHH